jgi:hypothetical protein
MATLRQMVGSETTAGREGMTTAELTQGMIITGEGVGEAQVQGMTKAEREIVLMIQGTVTTDGNSRKFNTQEKSTLHLVGSLENYHLTLNFFQGMDTCVFSDIQI